VYASDDAVRRILEAGRSLAEHGSNNCALTRAEALAAINAVEHESRVLLGGDVWLESDGALLATGDSWYFEPNPLASLIPPTLETAQPRRRPT
jgi:hypothetical protein